MWIRFQTHLFPLLPNICYFCFNMMHHGILNSKTKFVSKLLKNIAKNYENMAVLMVIRKSHLRVHLPKNAALLPPYSV